MIVVLSPSKTMDLRPSAVHAFSQPAFLDRSERLVETMRDFSVEQIMELMQVSEKLGVLNRQRFIDWSLPFEPGAAKQALFAFSGDVYDGLDAKSLNLADVAFAGDHLRMLSGLYGLLRPLDLIMPYRLEMGRKLAMGDARNLYEFWREPITSALNRSGESVLVNLASQEYFKAIDQRALNMSVVTPVFKDEKNGKLKVISFYAKKARGMMARFIIQNRIEQAEALVEFCDAGYAYDPAISSEFEPVFTRSI